MIYRNVIMIPVVKVEVKLPLNRPRPSPEGSRRLRHSDFDTFGT
jgi:hypothetical protein